MSNRRMWEYNLKAVFDLPASLIIVYGAWKVGKTDFSLFLVQELLRIGVIRKFGSNVELKDKYDNYKYINNIYRLKRWILGDKISKAFIYDEALLSTPKRRAMSRLNVEWIKVLAELSKGKCKLIVVTQDPKYTESVFFNNIFLRGVFIKKSKKIAELRSDLCNPNVLDLRNIPATKFKFDPYESALFSADPEVEVEEKDERFLLLNEWMKVKGNWSKVAEKHDMYPQQAKREILKAIEELMIQKI